VPANVRSGRKVFRFDDHAASPRCGIIYGGENVYSTVPGTSLSRVEHFVFNLVMPFLN